MKLNEVIDRWDSLSDEVKARYAVEVKIVASVIRNVLATDNWVLEGIWDDDEDKLFKTPTFEKAMKRAFACDDARIYFIRKHGASQERAWVYFIFGNGNGGYDVISDYTLSQHGFEDALNKITDESANGEEEV